MITSTAGGGLDLPDHRLGPGEKQIAVELEHFGPPTVSLQDLLFGGTAAAAGGCFDDVIARPDCGSPGPGDMQEVQFEIA